MSKKKTNFIACMWCGTDIVNTKVRGGRLEILGELAKHLLACENHPLAKRIDELIKENRRLKSQNTRLKNKLKLSKCI